MIRWLVLPTTAALLAVSLIAGPLRAADPPTVPVEDWAKQADGKTGIPDGWKGQNWGSPKYDFRIVTQGGLASLYNTGAHGFTEALYAYTSQSNNNGSAFAGYGGKTFSEQLGTIGLILGRFGPLLAALAIGGSLAAKKTHPASAGTFRTDGATFSVLLVAVIILTAGLMILPALTLGPIVEALQ